MDSFALTIRNLRSFKNRTKLPIKPITVIVGKNSSGKSTLTRLIPLLQQTFESRASTPILWYGRQVDFGSFRDSIPRTTTTDQIELAFNLTLPPVRYYTPLYDFELDIPQRVNTSRPISLSYKAIIGERNERTTLLGFDIKTLNDVLVVRLDAGGHVAKCALNKTDYTQLYNADKLRFSIDSLIPKLIGRTSATGHVRPIGTPHKIVEDLMTLFTTFFHGHTGNKTIRTQAARLSYLPKKDLERYLSTMPNSSDSFRRNMRYHVSHQDPRLDTLRKLLFLAALPRILSTIEGALSQILSSSAYIAPSRASGLRYYRWQELAIDRLDPTGENFAMYMMSLNDTEQGQFSKLMSDAFGYEVRAERQRGNASLVIRELGSDEWFNIADMGYGFSQILPVVAQIHAVLYRRLRRPLTARFLNTIKDRLIAVEQPELHLHPEYQARIANLFAAAIYQDDHSSTRGRAYTGIRLIAETHSEAFVNAIGKLIASKAIDPEDVSINICEHETGSAHSILRSAKYSEDGSIENWPIGFFLP